MIEPQHVPQHLVRPAAFLEPRQDIGAEGLDRLLARRNRVFRPVQTAVDIGEQPGVVIGSPAQHHPVDMLKMRLGLVEICDAAIDADVEVRQALLQPVDADVVERRNIAVFLGRKALQPGLAGMHPQGIDTGRDDGVGQLVERLFRVLVVDADAALDGHRDRNHLAHRRNAFGDQFRLAHQAGAETAGLHPVGRAADIEVHLVIAEILDHAGRLRQLLRIGAAELAGNGVFHGVEAKEFFPVAMNDRGRRDHLGIEQRVGTEVAVERPAIAVRPFHHRGDCEDFFSAMILIFHDIPEQHHFSS